MPMADFEKNFSYEIMKSAFLFVIKPDFQPRTSVFWSLSFLKRISNGFHLVNVFVIRQSTCLTVKFLFVELLTYLGKFGWPVAMV